MIDEIDAARAEAEAALAAAIAERPALAAAQQAAARLAHNEQHAFENAHLSVARATRHGQDPLTTAVAQLLQDQQHKRDRAAAAATLTKARLGNLDWIIECRRAELEQLELFENPPVPGQGPKREIVKRPPPLGPELGDDDGIVFPAGRSRPAADAAA